MDLKSFEKIHIGNRISDFVKKRNLSVYNTLSQNISKTPAGIYKDFEKNDLSFKLVFKYLFALEIDFYTFLESLGFTSDKSTLTLNEDEEHYAGKNHIVASLQREIELLNKILEEKERLIRVLIKSEKV